MTRSNLSSRANAAEPGSETSLSMHTWALKGHLLIRGLCWLNFPKNLPWGRKDQPWAWIQRPTVDFPSVPNLPGISPNTKQPFSYCIISGKLSAWWYHLVGMEKRVAYLNISLEFSNLWIHSDGIWVFKSLIRYTVFIFKNSLCIIKLLQQVPDEEGQYWEQGGSSWTGPCVLAPNTWSCTLSIRISSVRSTKLNDFFFLNSVRPFHSVLGTLNSVSN